MSSQLIRGITNVISNFKNYCCIKPFFLTLFVSANEQLETLSNQLALKNAQVYSQSYIIGGQPTVADLKKLADAKIKGVINLRGESEFSSFNEQEVVENLGMRYVSLPIANSQDINSDNIDKFHQILVENKGNAMVHCARNL